MLKKLYYYEARYYAKTALPIIIALVAASLVAMLFPLIKIEFIQFLTIMPYPLLLVAMACLPTVIVVIRFYRHLFTLQGYLSFTLPVNSMDHFFCKLINAIVFHLVMIGLTVLSILFVGTAIAQDFLFIEAVKSFLGQFESIYLYSGILLLVVQSLFALIIFYTAICIGQLAKNKILVSVGVWVGINYGSQLVNSFFLMPVMFLVLHNIDMEFEVLAYNYLPVILVLFSALYFLETIAAVFVCRHIITKKLNLE